MRRALEAAPSVRERHVSPAIIAMPMVLRTLTRKKLLDVPLADLLDAP